MRKTKRQTVAIDVKPVALNENEKIEFNSSIKIKDIKTDHILVWQNPISLKITYASINEISEHQIFYTKADGQCFSWLLESMYRKIKEKSMAIVTRTEVPKEILKLLEEKK